MIDRAELDTWAEQTRKDALRARVANDLVWHTPAHPVIAEAMGMVRERALAFAHFIIDTVPDGRELTLALTDVEHASMHAIAALARNQDRALAAFEVTVDGDQPEEAPTP